MEDILIIPYADTYREAFIEAYKSIFKEAPYLELFTDEECEQVIRTTELYLLIDSRNELLGFVGGSSLELFYQKYSEEELKLKAHINESIETYYIAELGVLTQKQKSGLGGFLFKKFLEIQKNKGYRQFILFTAEKNNKAQHLYESLGFEVLKDDNKNVVYHCIFQTRIDEIEKSDNRPYYILKDY